MDFLHNALASRNASDAFGAVRALGISSSNLAALSQQLVLWSYSFTNLNVAAPIVIEIQKLAQLQPTLATVLRMVQLLLMAPHSTLFLDYAVFARGRGNGPCAEAKTVNELIDAASEACLHMPIIYRCTLQNVPSEGFLLEVINHTVSLPLEKMSPCPALKRPAECLISNLYPRGPVMTWREALQVVPGSTNGATQAVSFVAPPVPAPPPPPPPAPAPAPGATVVSKKRKRRQSKPRPLSRPEKKAKTSYDAAYDSDATVSADEAPESKNRKVVAGLGNPFERDDILCLNQVPIISTLPMPKQAAVAITLGQQTGCHYVAWCWEARLRDFATVLNGLTGTATVRSSGELLYCTVKAAYETASFKPFCVGDRVTMPAVAKVPFLKVVFARFHASIFHFDHIYLVGKEIVSIDFPIVQAPFLVRKNKFAMEELLAKYADLVAGMPKPLMTANSVQEASSTN